MKEYRVPVQVFVVCYRIDENGASQFLLLKRSKARGGFWQPVTGAPESHSEPLVDAAKREVREETGFETLVRLSDVGCSYEFEVPPKYAHVYDPQTEKIIEHVFAAQVERGRDPVLSSEHQTFRWVTFDEAIALLRYDTNIRALSAVKGFLRILLLQT